LTNQQLQFIIFTVPIGVTMLLDVSDALLLPGVSFNFIHDEEIPPQQILGDTVSFDAAKLAGIFEVHGDVLRLQGVYNVTAHAHCVNCLKEISRDIEISFDETFKHVSHEAMPENLMEDFLYFEGKHVDLYPLALTLTVLAIPMRYLCKEDCKGYEKVLSRINQSTINACRETLDEAHPFAALKQLLTEDQEV